jgi:hypothetical protein
MTKYLQHTVEDFFLSTKYRFVEKLTSCRLAAGQPLRLRAKAVGQPTPCLAWQKESNQKIIMALISESRCFNQPITLLYSAKQRTAAKC